MGRVTGGYENDVLIDRKKKSNRTILIEEPELSLHPNFQSLIADVICMAWQEYGVKFIIETHSEYLIRKLQFWVAKYRINSDDINIYYLNNQNSYSEVEDSVLKKIKIRKDGSLSEPFGEGFFDEAINLKFELLKLKSLN